MCLFSLPQRISVVNNARNSTYGEDQTVAIVLKYGGSKKRAVF